MTRLLPARRAVAVAVAAGGLVLAMAASCDSGSPSAPAVPTVAPPSATAEPGDDSGGRGGRGGGSGEGERRSGDG